MHSYSASVGKNANAFWENSVRIFSKGGTIWMKGVRGCEKALALHKYTVFLYIYT
jgi:hypothetical protein